MSLTIPLTRACGYRVELGNADNVATYADGQRVMITRGMLGFIQSDEELAYLIAKEMAHNALSHPNKNRSYSSMGAMIDNLLQIKPDLSLLITGGGIKSYSAELDGASDQLALYLLLRAGYSIENTRNFWQRLANQYPANVLSSHTALHPATSARMTAMDKAMSEIKTKQANKRPLVP
jgi:beta-barrel assembly-enhancing protease